MILGTVSARLGSERLPAKVLLPFGNSTMVGHIFDIVDRSRVNKTVLCTPDAFLGNFVNGESCVWDGSRDIIAELWTAAERYQADHIVRITADCPFITPEIINLVIYEHITHDYHYTHNGNDIIGPDGADGQNVEVVSVQALKKLWLTSKNREHLVSDNLIDAHYVKAETGNSFSVDTLEQYKKAYLIGGNYNGNSPQW